jgi:hypothetical protein
MPLVFRAMRKDEDGFPLVARSARALGVRPGTDIDVDDQDNAIVNNKGMSVSPVWRDMSIFFIPKRLDKRGQGSNNTYCFKRGTGPFQRTPFAPGLELVPDSARHGVVCPLQLAPLAQYEADLAATRSEWQIDET